MNLKDIEVDEFYRINKFYPEKDFRGKTIKVISVRPERAYKVIANLLTPLGYFGHTDEILLIPREISEL